MRYHEHSRSHGQNGHPSWPQLLEVMDRGLTRIHERIDDTQASLHAKIDEVRDRVITIETTIAADRPEHRSRAARLRAWLELVAPLRELLAMAAVTAAGIAGLTHSPEAKALLSGLAARLGL